MLLTLKTSHGVQNLRNTILAISFSFLFSAFASANQNNHSIYIWQRNWTPLINESITAISKETNQFIVLAGQGNISKGQLSLVPVNIDWSAFGSNKAEVTIALRFSTPLKALFQRNQYGEVARIVADLVRYQEAQSKEVKIKGVQFDYDCPTSKLMDYAQFLQMIRKELDGYQIAIISLPTWLSSPDFKNVVHETDYYVLQLYSFEIPQSPQAKREIFLEYKAFSYIKQAKSLNHPFQIALPTYGYEVAFDQKGKFIGLRAETDSVVWGPEAQVFIEMTQSSQILNFLNKFRNDAPKNFQGLCWFRLPSKSDEFNWDIKTLAAIMEDRPPERNIKAEFVSKDNDLYELYFENDGEENLNNPVHLDVRWPEKSHVFYDFVSDYSGEYTELDKEMRISGPAPRVDEKVLVAWFRNSDGNTNNVPVAKEVVINE